MKNCPFCKLATERRSSAFEALFPEAKASYEIVDESDNFLVVLDAAPLAEGHCLIVSKEHFHGIYSVWDELGPEIVRLQTRIIEQVRAIWGTGVMLCEHGCVTGQTKIRCIQHAHIHVIPSSGCLASALLKDGVRLERGRDYDGFPDQMTKDEYFILRDVDGTSWAAFEGDFPSQLIRRIFASENGLRAWSWRDYVDMPKLLKTRDTIAAAHRKLHGDPANTYGRGSPPLFKEANAEISRNL
jgi:diadenosine tetraphosphate (Ap4A) HIT family hydrolase